MTSKSVVKRPPTVTLPGVNAALRPPKKPASTQTKAQRQEAGRLGGRHRVANGTGHQFTAGDASAASAAGKKGRAKQLAAKAQQRSKAR